MTWDRQCQIMLGSVVLDNCCSTGRQSVPLLWCTGTLHLNRPCPPWLNINNSHQASNGCLKGDELIGTHFRKNDQGGATAVIFLEWPQNELTQTVLFPTQTRISVFTHSMRYEKKKWDQRFCLMMRWLLTADVVLFVITLSSHCHWIDHAFFAGSDLHLCDHYSLIHIDQKLDFHVKTFSKVMWTAGSYDSSII